MRIRNLFFTAVALCIAHPADAQSITLIPCWRPAIGIGIGPMANADRNGGGSEFVFPERGAARNVNASVDVPVGGGPWAARVDAGTVSWAFADHDYLGNVRVRDRVRLKRITAGAMKIIGPGPCDLPLRLYFGGGAGVYRFEFEQGGTVSRGGAHIFGGIDVQFVEHAAVGVAFSVHGIGGPDRRPVFSQLFLAGQVSVAMKLVF